MLKIRLTSLLLVEERLLEAQYFARRLTRQRAGDGFRYELNAFLSAARSVTFLLQKEMARVPRFRAWWDAQRLLLASDAAAVFFLRLRNFSQKEGRVSVVGGYSSSGRRRWSYRFAGNADPVPPTLLNRDIAGCCREHVAKLARVVLACTDAFPYQTCPRRALTPDGVRALKLSLEDVEESLGFPRGWTDIGAPLSHDRRVYALREHVDGLDFPALRRLAQWKSRPEPVQETPSSVLSEEILSLLVAQLEGPRRRVVPADLAVSLLVGRTSEHEASDT